MTLVRWAAAAVVMQAAGTCGGGATKSLNLLTRDEGEVVILCKDNGKIEAPAAFLVSRNNDDDERHRPDDRDRGRASLHALENNIRPLRFRGETRAVTVKVSPPEDATTAKAQEGRRVRSWQDPFTGGRFDFTIRHPLPATLNVEGKEKSRGEDDTVYRFVFYDPAGAGVCEGQLPGTVVLVEARLKVTGDGAPDENRKLLILGTGSAEVSLSPAVTLDPEWSYPGGSAFADPHALTTTFTADSMFTPTMERDTLRVELTSRHGQRIVAHRPLNLTGPRSVTVKRGGGFTVETGWLDANQGTFSLFRKGVTYTMRDQFGEPIKESALGGAMPQIRENIGNALQSGIGTVTAWIQTQLQWTQAWRDKPAGEFTDSLKVQQITKDVIRRAVVLAPGVPAGRYEFDPILQGGGQMMAAAPSHIWYLTVNGREGAAVRVEATHNVFDVTAFATRPQGGGIQIRLRSRYEVHAP